MTSGDDSLFPFYGDLHNHCDISYGHGPLEDAYRNARMQLDFVSVTAHAHWPDLPDDDERLAAVNDYHRKGFERALEQWPRYREITNAVNTDHELTTLLSFEWHSLRSGDHNIYYRGNVGEIIPADDLVSMRDRLRDLGQNGVDAILIPHHIGYLRGYRGINWSEFTPELSPFAEIFSMHGSSESDEGPYPYLHTMGPRDGRSTMQHGLAEGNIFGVVGSTDHHNGHPGSYGHGRLGVWARELTREGIWEAITARRTWALTGDNIQLAFTINGQPMGSILPEVSEREIEVSVIGGDAIDYIEVLHDNAVIKRSAPVSITATGDAGSVKVLLEVGWGEQDDETAWDVALEVSGGRLATVEPRFRGRDVVSPQAVVDEAFAFSAWEQPDEHHLTFSTRSWQNPTIVSPATQGMCLEIEGDAATVIRGTINGKHVAVNLGELMTGSRAGYLGGFLTPAWCFHRAVPRDAYCRRLSFTHHQDAADPAAGWYYVRVRQYNGQWAWSSPIWVGGNPNTQ